MRRFSSPAARAGSDDQFPLSGRAGATSSASAAPSSGASANGAPRADSVMARYEVQGRVGESTLFIVYRAKQKQGARQVALRALKGSYARHDAFVSTLLAAQQKQLAFSHPALIELDEVGNEEGTPFSIEQWLPGPTLEERLRRAPLSDYDTTQTLRHLARGLDYLHSAGMAHGDLRPRQIGSLNDGTLKISGAGVAQALSSADLRPTDIFEDSIYYQSPERSENEHTSPADDLYALGVILYRMLAGRQPFDGPSPLSIALRHRRDTPMSPSQFNPNCAIELEAIALKLLEKSPAARYPDAKSVLAALDAYEGVSAADAEYSEDDAPVAGDANATQPLPPAKTAAPVVVTPAAVTPSVAAVSTQSAAAPISDDDFKVLVKKQRRRDAWGAFFALFWLLVAGGALFGIFYGSYSYLQQDVPPEVKVPNYIGKSEDEARRLLEAKKLTLKATSQRYDPKRPAGTVLEGQPPPGKVVRIGREVNVIVSRGEEPTTAPPFTEMSLPRVREIIQKAGMRLGAVAEQYHDTIPKGYVCGQFPEPGQSMRRSEPINLIVSRGSQQLEALEAGKNTAPGLSPEDFMSETPAVGSAPDTAMISRVVQVRVTVPTSGGNRQVRIVVRDAGGERTVYENTHSPGELVEEYIQVTRPQNKEKARIRVYLGNTLLQEQFV